jgi:hypothetical protein
MRVAGIDALSRGQLPRSLSISHPAPPGEQNDSRHLEDTMTTDRDNSSQRNVAPEDPSVADAAEEYQIVHAEVPTESAADGATDDVAEESPADSPLE